MCHRHNLISLLYGFGIRSLQGNLYGNPTTVWGGAPWKIILSVLGLDGYLLYRTDDYYLIGEWFLGAIILLYLIGHYAMKLRIVDLVISRISGVSFLVFLLQHMIIVYVLQFIHPLSFGKAALSILGVTCTSIILADVLFIITRRITDSLAGRSRLFRLISGNPR